MYWLVFLAEVMFALAAAILSIIGLTTLKTIKHLGIGRPFWTPISISSILFLLGSVVRILQEYTPVPDLSLIVSFSWLIALCSLMIGIYNFSRTAKTEARTRYYEMDSESRPRLITHVQEAEKKKILAKRKADKSVPVCPHHFGYLSEIPEDASIPEECLTCPQMLACKNMPTVRTR